MSANITDHLAQDKVARIMGGFYLAYIRPSPLPRTTSGWAGMSRIGGTS